MSQRRFAVVGASNDSSKYGNRIYKNLRSRDYEVYAVNPSLDEMEGDKCYHTLVDIPVKVGVVDIVVPPQVTEEIVKQCHELGLDRIWMQPGAESEAAIDYCHRHNLRVVHGACVMVN
jgi:predicted CoA-binding protein